MAGERDLARLLQDLKPKLYSDRHAFLAIVEPALRADQFALIREDEGLTSIQRDPEGDWARISLEIHSSLDAIGLTAVISSRLATSGISTNIVAGRLHDHLFVPWNRRDEALAVLRGLSSGA